MSFSTSLEIVQLLAIVALGLGLAASLRATALLQQRIDAGTESAASPVLVGERLSLPPQLAGRIPDQALVVLHFGRSDCTRCVSALRRLNSDLEHSGQRNGFQVVSLWTGNRPAEAAELSDIDLPNHESTLISLGIAVAPYFVVVDSSRTVLAAGALMRKTDIDQLLGAAKAAYSSPAVDEEA